MNRRIFTYWVNPPEGLFPYIQLCVQTWFKHIPGLELIVLNHENIQEWIDNDIFNLNFNKFTMLSLPIQSDIASLLILKKHGGIFMDADTIVFKDIFVEINALNPEKLFVFGCANTFLIQVAIMICLQSHNRFISAMADIALKRLNEISTVDILSYGTPTSKIQWSYFCNEIFEIVFKNEEVKNYLEILDRTETGNILESSFFTEAADSNERYKHYVEFYFSSGVFSVKKAVEKIKFGAVSLHNSWTPSGYKKFSPEQVIACPMMLSELIKYSLGKR